MFTCDGGIKTFTVTLATIFGINIHVYLVTRDTLRIFTHNKKAMVMFKFSLLKLMMFAQMLMMIHNTNGIGFHVMRNIF